MLSRNRNKKYDAYIVAIEMCCQRKELSSFIWDIFQFFSNQGELERTESRSILDVHSPA